MLAPLIPAPIKRLSGHAKPNDEVSSEALRFDLTPFFPPQPHQGVFIVAHDNPGIRQQRTAAPQTQVINSPAYNERDEFCASHTARW